MDITDDIDDQPTWMDNKFYAVPKNIVCISKLIKCIAFAEKVNIYINETGIRMTVEEGKVFQVCVFLQKELFQIYQLNDEELALKTSLKEMLDCLKKITPEFTRQSTIRATDPTSNAKMFFTVDNEETVFKMLLVEDSVETFFQMRLESYDEMIEFEINPVTVQVLMKAQELWEYFRVLEDVSPELIGIKVGNDSLTISADCTEGSVELVIPTNADLVDSFECADPIKATYKLSSFKHAVKVMAISSKCALKLDPRGILCFSFLIEGDVESFVEYYCLPQVPDTETDIFT